jgi:hypothetical protein
MEAPGPWAKEGAEKTAIAAERKDPGLKPHLLGFHYRGLKPAATPNYLGLNSRFLRFAAE